MKKAPADAEAFNTIGQISIAAQTILQDNIMGTALDDARSGYTREFCRLTEFRQGQRTTVAHRAADLGQRRAAGRTEGHRADS